MAKVCIDLRFENEILISSAKIFLDNFVQRFMFSLGHKLKISEIRCDGKKVEWQTLETYEPLFCSKANKFLISTDWDFRELEIVYCGKIDGWHNFISEELIELNMYGVWFPCDIPIVEDLVKIKGCEDYFLLKGEYNPIENVWNYGGKGFDPFNIILYKKSVLKTVSSHYTSIFYIGKELTETAIKLGKIFDDILEYYSKELFGDRFINHTDIACVYPILTSGGAYKRKDLIVCIKPDDEENKLISLNGHELAHEWCNGADVCSWEDWLNETTAEWSMLLYALDRGKKAVFDSLITVHLEKSSKLPPIKTKDGSRPEGVHSKGSVLFYDIYIAFGVDAVKEIIRLFVTLETKSTEELLNKMKICDMIDVAEFMENRLTMV